jgi:hypothetical protein
LREPSLIAYINPFCSKLFCLCHVPLNVGITVIANREKREREREAKKKNMA